MAAVRSTPVEMLFSSAEALGMTAPEASVTSPVTVPRLVCANAVAAISRKTAEARTSFVMAPSVGVVEAWNGNGTSTLAGVFAPKLLHPCKTWDAYFSSFGAYHSQG